MRQDAASGWLAFEARQTIRIAECAFKWRAKVGPAGLVRVTDSLGRDGGRLTATALGLIPVARAGGSAAVTRGELMRYLAELAWAPDAMLHNPQLGWRTEGADGLVVTAGEGPCRADVTLRLDQDGRIASASAPDRPRAVGRTFVPTPWRGRFLDYRFHEGRWLPFRGEVGWILDGREVVCWEGALTTWGLSDATGREPLSPLDGH